MKAARPLLVAATLSASATTLPACAGRGGELSSFEEDAQITGRVVENVTACTVDATCYLGIEFADTTIHAMYGLGEGPAPACEIPSSVSDTAFQIGAGDLVAVRLMPCGSEGYALSSVRTSERRDAPR